MVLPPLGLPAAFRYYERGYVNFTAAGWLALGASMHPVLANSTVKVIPSRIGLENFRLERTEPLERGLDCLA
jgi:hypothetical protein